MNLFLVILLAALFATLMVAWAKGFAFRTPRKHQRFASASDLPLFTRLRFSFAILIAGFLPPARGDMLFANFNSSEHLEGRITYTADNAFTDAGQQAGRFLVAKIGTDAAHIDLCGATDKPHGICTDAPAAGDVGSVSVLGAARGTLRGIAAVAIAVDDPLYTAASGRITNVPVNGCYFIGKAVSTASAAGDDFEFTPIKPIRVVKVTLTAPGTAAGSDAGTTQTLANAIRTDLTALQTACSTPSLILLA
jgi:hypothetical protein